MKNKEMYYIMTAADGEKESMITTLACFRGYADCVEGADTDFHMPKGRCYLAHGGEPVREGRGAMLSVNHLSTSAFSSQSAYSTSPDTLHPHISPVVRRCPAYSHVSRPSAYHML